MGINKRDRNHRRSPSSDNDYESTKRPYNYLQRIQSSKNRRQPTFVYLQAEFLRLTIDLIHKFNFKNSLKEYLSSLDRGESISLSDISNSSIRKKMRHLLRALYVEEKDGFYSKSPECDISLRGLLDEFRDYIDDKCKNLPKPKDLDKYNIIIDEKPKELLKDNIDDNISDSKEEIDLKTSLKSLRELHEEGFYIGYKEMQEEFMKKHKMTDLWGLSVEEQIHLMNNQDDDEDYVTGNAVSSVLNDTVRQLDKSAYKDLIASGKQFRDNFT